MQTVVAELTALTSAGARSLVSAAAAEAHLRSTLNGILNAALGTYTGTSVNTVFNCTDPSFNRTNLSNGSLTITSVSLNSNGATFTGNGSFSLTVEGITVREDFTINANSSTMDFTGTLNGTIIAEAYVDGVFQGSESSSYTGFLDGNSLTIVTPERLNQDFGFVICDLSGSTLDLSKVITTLTQNELVGTWAVSNIEGIPVSVGGPSSVDASNSTFTIKADGTYDWFFLFDRDPFFFDFNGAGTYSLNGSELSVDGVLADTILELLQPKVVTLTVSSDKNTFSFLDDENDRWTYNRL